MSNYDSADHPRNQILKDGKWVEKAQTPGDMTLTAGEYANNTPSEIDVVLARLWSEQQRPVGSIVGDRDRIRVLRAEAVAREVKGLPVNPQTEIRIADAEKRITAAQAAVDAIQQKIEPINLEFDARGGWTRFYVTTNSNPHVHRSMRCSTCRPTTQFGWLTDHSGMDEDEIVELAGDEACTVCYPSAPAAVRGAPRQNRLMTPEARQEKAEKDAKALAAAEKNRVESLYSATGDAVYDERSHPFKNEKAAEREAVSGLASSVWYDNHPTAPVWNRVAANVEDAIALKRGITVAELRETWAKKIAAKTKKDGAPQQWAKNGPRLFDGVDAHKAEVAGLTQLRDDLRGLPSRTAADDERIRALNTALDLRTGKLLEPRK